MMDITDVRKVAKTKLAIFGPSAGLINVEEFIFARLDLASMSAEITELEIKTILEEPGRILAEIESQKPTPTRTPNPLPLDWPERIFYYQLFGWEIRKCGTVYTFILLDEERRKVGGLRSERPQITLEEWLTTLRKEVNKKYCRGDIY